jgi:hypothetical protein
MPDRGADAQHGAVLDISRGLNPQTIQRPDPS